jgi:hypothetical protein
VDVRRHRTELPTLVLPWNRIIIVDLLDLRSSVVALLG